MPSRFRVVALIAALLLSVCMPVFSQNQGNTWVFGDGCALDFNSGAPVSFPGGQNTGIEGAAVISATSGCLLFYTDGATIWDSTHSVMQNGTGINTVLSPTMCGVIVPHPGSVTLFDVFSIDGAAGINGLRHSVVDMTANNGLGAVTTKNVFLTGPVVEKITAIRHQNGNDVWIIVHKYNSNEFYSYPLTTLGVGVPVVTATGITHNVLTHYQGWMNANWTEDRIVLALSGGSIRGYYLYNFNKATGVLSNEVILNNFGFTISYGAEFSPDGSKLYGNGSNQDIIQFDLTAGTATQIVASLVIVGTFQSPVQVAHSIHSGPDKKIYITGWQGTALGIIQDPDSLGLKCNFAQTGATIGSGTITASLPYIPKYLLTYNNPSSCICKLTVSAKADSAKCAGDSSGSILAIPANGKGPFKFSWSTGDSTDFITGLPSGFYTVTVTDSMGCQEINSFFVPQPAGPLLSVTGPDSVCPGECITLKALVAGTNGPFFYKWSPVVSTSDSVNDCPWTTTNYIVTATDSNECQAHDTFPVKMHPVPVAGFKIDSTTGCDSICVQFTDLTPGNQVWWKWDFGDGDTSGFQNPGHCFTDTGIYNVTLIVGNSGGCRDTLTNPGAVIVTPCIGLVSDPELYDFFIYPNPVIRDFEVRLPVHFSGNLFLQLRDLSGREVFRRQESVGNARSVHYTIPELPGAIYLFTIATDDGMACGKLRVTGK